MSKLRKPAKFPIKAAKKAVVIIVVIALAALAFSFKDSIVSSAEEILAQGLDARVKSIMVEGAQYSDPVELQAAISLDYGDALMGFNASATRKRLEALPWVKDASVHRQLPSTVHVEIFEYQPVARLEDAEGITVIDSTGYQIAAATEDFAHLPLISGEGAGGNVSSLLALLANKPNLESQLIKADYIGNRRWDLYFASGVLVKLPEVGVKRALSILQQLEGQRHVLTMAKGIVDLRLEDRIVLELTTDTPESDLVL